MKKRIIVQSLTIIFLIGLLRLIAFAWHDGKMWEKLDKAAKIAYVAGYKDGEENGLSIRSIYENKTTQALNIEQRLVNQNKILYNADIPQVVSGIDKFYSDYANIYLPLPIAFQVVTDRIQGVSEDEVQKYIEERRKEVSNATNEINEE